MRKKKRISDKLKEKILKLDNNQNEFYENFDHFQKQDPNFVLKSDSIVKKNNDKMSNIIYSLISQKDYDLYISLVSPFA